MKDYSLDPERVERRTTICTPSFLLSRRNNASMLMGAVLFLLFFTVSIFLVVAMGYLVDAFVPKFVKVVGIGILALALYGLMWSIYIVDSLSSLDEKMSRQVEYLKRLEKHNYNLYIMAGKLSKGLKTKGD
jgi:hypothetical protein